MTRAVSAYVTLLLFLEYVGNRKEYTTLLYIAKLVIDSRSKHLHCRREAHIGVDKRRDIEAVFPHLMIEYLVILLECLSVKKPLHSLVINRCVKGADRPHKHLGIWKMLLKEIKYEVAARAVIARIHGHLAEKIFDFGMLHCKCTKAVPQVVESE